MTYILIVYNKKGKEVFRKEYKGVSGHFMMDIYQDYAHLGGRRSNAEIFNKTLGEI